MSTCFMLNIMVHDALICLTSMNLGKMVVNGSFRKWWYPIFILKSEQISIFTYMVYDGKFT